MRAALIEAVTHCSPLPDRPESGLELKVVAYLKLIHDLHCRLRYFFQCVEMRSPLSWDESQIVPSVPALDRILVRLAVYLMMPTERSALELMYLGFVKDSGTLITVLTNVYNAFLRFPPNVRPIDAGLATTKTAKDAVLGWSNITRSSLPLAESACLMESRSAGYLGAALSRSWQSGVLNAITVSPSQGQREWLAIVTDRLAVEIQKPEDLCWFNFVVTEASGTFAASQSLVVDEIVMTESTIQRPNELFRLINPIYVDHGVVDYIYKARRKFSILRVTPGTPAVFQPAPAARAMVRHVRFALRCADSTKRRMAYEKWIQSEWDAPSILFDICEIRDILIQLDNKLIKDYITTGILCVLVVDHRGLKSVCARARSVVHTAISRMGPSPIPSHADNPFAEVRVKLAESLQTLELVRAEFESHGSSQPLTFKQSRITGTDIRQVERLRRLWDLVFNVTIEAVYTSLPWIAVSHSWAQADGDCISAINERANMIPWATRVDLNNVRGAALQCGFTMAWMDKVCLRQRGIDGFDSALRRLEWFTDIPFIDLAYSKAAKILVYLEGAGRPLRYRSTFRRKTSWLYRKWTAQETPSGIDLVLGSEDHCLPGEFFQLCEHAVRSWHLRNHRGSMMTMQTCHACDDVRERLRAVQALRDLPTEASELERLRCVCNVMQGRTAGSAADHAFSLLSLLGTHKRPKYDPSYNREQAISLVKEHLRPSIRAILGAEEQSSWFDGMFSITDRSVDDKIGPMLAAFCPERASVGGVSCFRLQGIISAKKAIHMYIDGRIVGIADGANMESETQCACRQAVRSLNLGPHDIYSDYFVWHGTRTCCAAVPDMVATDQDRMALETASHLLLSQNRLKCVLLRLSGNKNHPEGDYQILPSGQMVTFSTSSEWIFKPNDVQPRAHFCRRIE